MLRAAHGNAARSGLDGALLDVVAGRSRPAGELVDSVTPALRGYGDLDAVTSGLDRLRREGTGAARQRALLDAAGGPITAILPKLAAATVAG